MGRLRRPYGPLNGVLLFYSFSGYTGSIGHRTFRHSRDGRIDASTVQVTRCGALQYCVRRPLQILRFMCAYFPGSWRSCVNSMLQRTRLGPGVCVRHFRSSPVKVNTVKWMSFPRVSVFPESICRAVLCHDIGATALGCKQYWQY